MGGYIKSNKGFTLMELILAVVVVSIFLSALLPFIVENLTINARSKKKILATETANTKVEELRNQPFADIASSSFTVSSALGPSASGRVSVSQVDLNGDGELEDDIVKVKVDVTYPEKGSTQTITLDTLIAEKGVLSR